MRKYIGFGERLVVYIASFFVPFLALAAPAQPQPAQYFGSNPPPSAGFTSAQSILDFMCTIFGWLFYFLMALSVLFIVIAAYKYLTASGNPEKVKGANNTILYAAIAIAVALLARAIPVIVASFLGASGNIGACGLLAGPSL